MASDKLLSELTKGTWSAETLYTVGDISDHNGSSYISIKNGTNQEPPNAEYWALLASKGDQGERGETGASIVSASFVGDDMVFVKDDEDTIVIPEAKTDLTGAQGLPGDPGQDGREVELQKSATHVQWRYVGEETWNDLVALVDLKGADGEDGTDGTNGREIELQKTDTYIQWRYADDVSWTNLVALADLKGDKGDTGEPGTSFVWKGEWDSETTYEANEAVEHNGSSYIAIAPNTDSEPPSADWELMAQKGLDGEGAGDVIGPSSAVSNNFAAFDGVTGKLIKDSGKKAADFETAGAAAAVQGNLEAEHNANGTHTSATVVTLKASSAEITTGTEDGKVVTPKGLADAGYLTGWIPAGETWTYASATRITVPSDARLKYQKGDKIRFKQGGDWKYMYVVGVAETYIDVTGGTDYTVANAEITSSYYSKIENPQGFPHYFNWLPYVFGSDTAGVGSYNSQRGRFCIKGNTCIFQAYCYWTSHTGSGNCCLAIPISPASTIATTPLDLGSTHNYDYPDDVIDIRSYITSGGGENYARLMGSVDATVFVYIPLDTAARLGWGGNYEI
jgi:hypothetical protein